MSQSQLAVDGWGESEEALRVLGFEPYDVYDLLYVLCTSCRLVQATLPGEKNGESGRWEVNETLIRREFDPHLHRTIVLKLLPVLDDFLGICSSSTIVLILSSHSSFFRSRLKFADPSRARLSTVTVRLPYCTSWSASTKLHKLAN